MDSFRRWFETPITLGLVLRVVVLVGSQKVLYDAGAGALIIVLVGGIVFSLACWLTVPHSTKGEA